MLVGVPRRKSCPALAGAGDGDAFVRRFPPWRRRRGLYHFARGLRVKTLIFPDQAAAMPWLLSLLGGAVLGA
jgi:hypothetical protein